MITLANIAEYVEYTQHSCAAPNDRALAIYRRAVTAGIVTHGERIRVTCDLDEALNADDLTQCVQLIVVGAPDEWLHEDARQYDPDTMTYTSYGDALAGMLGEGGGGGEQTEDWAICPKCGSILYRDPDFMAYYCYTCSEYVTPKANEPASDDTPILPFHTSDIAELINESKRDACRMCDGAGTVISYMTGQILCCWECRGTGKQQPKATGGGGSGSGDLWYYLAAYDRAVIAIENARRSGVGSLPELAQQRIDAFTSLRMRLEQELLEVTMGKKEVSQS